MHWFWNNLRKKIQKCLGFFSKMAAGAKKNPLMLTCIIIMFYTLYCTLQSFFACVVYKKYHCACLTFYVSISHNRIFNDTKLVTNPLNSDKNALHSIIYGTFVIIWLFDVCIAFHWYHVTGCSNKPRTHHVTWTCICLQL